MQMGEYLPKCCWLIGKKLISVHPAAASECLVFTQTNEKWAAGGFRWCADSTGANGDFDWWEQF